MMRHANRARRFCRACLLFGLIAGVGVTGIRVDRPCQELILDHNGQDTAKLKDLSLKDLRAAMPRTERTDEARFALDDRYAADPRDTASPRAFVTLDRRRLRRILGASARGA